MTISTNTAVACHFYYLLKCVKINITFNENILQHLCGLSNILAYKIIHTRCIVISKTRVLSRLTPISCMQRIPWSVATKILSIQFLLPDMSILLIYKKNYTNLNQLSSACTALIHYANTPIQYTAIFHGCKNGLFQMNFCNIFLIFAQNIDCGYSLEPPH